LQCDLKNLDAAFSDGVSIEAWIRESAFVKSDASVFVLLQQLVNVIRERPHLRSVEKCCEFVVLLGRFDFVFTGWVSSGFRIPHFMATSPHLLYFIDQLIRQGLMIGPLAGRIVLDICIMFYIDPSVRPKCIVEVASGMGNIAGVANPSSLFISQVRRFVPGSEETWLFHPEYRHDGWQVKEVAGRSLLRESHLETPCKR
jgi:hypothetical protein